MSVTMPAPDEATLARRAAIVADLSAIVPGEGVIDAPIAMRAFETDGLTAYRQLPLVVVLPETTAQVAAVLRYCHENSVKVVPRGSGTSLSGGALPLADGVLLGWPVQPHPGDRLRQPLRGGAARRDQSRHHRRPSRHDGLLLRARSVVARSPARSAATWRRTPAACIA